MKQGKFNKGFSLTEVLIAAGILVIGLMMILGTFPVGIKLTAVSTERTIGVVAANEAFDKVQLYGINQTYMLYNHLNNVNDAFITVILSDILQASKPRTVLVI